MQPAREPESRFENSESPCSETSVCVMGKNVWLCTAFLEQRLYQRYSTFKIYVGQFSKMTILIFIKETIKMSLFTTKKHNQCLGSTALHSHYHNTEQCALWWFGIDHAVNLGVNATCTKFPWVCSYFHWATCTKFPLSCLEKWSCAGRLVECHHFPP